MSNKQPLVSVVIPNYNYARYFDERMRSILNQTYQNFEIIILDDCSTDNSLEVIEKYRSHPKVSKIVVNETNTGSPFKQWNRGIKLAQGELIWMAEADDSAKPTFLEELVQGYVLNPKCTLMYCYYTMIDENGNGAKEGGDGKRLMINGLNFIRNYLIYGVSIHGVNSVVFSRRVALEVDKSYMDYKGCGDWRFYVGLAERGYVFQVRKNLHLYRRHSGTVTSIREIDGSNVKENKIIYDYIVEKGYVGHWTRFAAKTNICLGYIKRNFLTKEIQEEAFRLWGITPKTKKYAGLVVKISHYRLNFIHLMNIITCRV